MGLRKQGGSINFSEGNEDGFTFFVPHRFIKKEKKWRIARFKKDKKCEEELESREKKHNKHLDTEFS
jgi:hypothetical protein